MSSLIFSLNGDPMTVNTNLESDVRVLGEEIFSIYAGEDSNHGEGALWGNYLFGYGELEELYPFALIIY